MNVRNRELPNVDLQQNSRKEEAWDQPERR